MTVAPEQAIAGRPEQLRVTRAGGDVVVLIKPEIVQDSVKGRRAATASPDSNALAFPLSDVRSMALLKKDPTMTMFLVAGMAVGGCFDAHCCGLRAAFNTGN